MGGGWYGHERAAELLGVPTWRIAGLVDAGILKQREVHFHGRFTNGVRQEIAIAELEQLHQVLRLAGYFEVTSRLEAVKQLLQGGAA